MGFTVASVQMYITILYQFGSFGEAHNMSTLSHIRHTFESLSMDVALGSLGKDNNEQNRLKLPTIVLVFQIETTHFESTRVGSGGCVDFAPSPFHSCGYIFFCTTPPPPKKKD